MTSASRSARPAFVAPGSLAGSADLSPEIGPKA